MALNHSTQVYEMVPFMKYAYTSFEKNYDAQSSLEFAENHMALPLILSACYLMACYIGSAYMNRPSIERFDLKYPLV